MIDRATVEHIARLARLDLKESDVELFRSQLSAIIDHIDALKKLDCAKVEPLLFPGDLHNVFRDDSSAPSLPRNEALANAPSEEGGFFKVPPVIEREL